MIVIVIESDTHDYHHDFITPDGPGNILSGCWVFL